MSANMDSVTGREMAQAMALEGGIGVIHRALPIERQAEAVARVKRSHGAVIEQPVLPARAAPRIREAQRFARRHNVTGILIEESAGSGVLAGLLSEPRHARGCAELEDRPVDEFMTPVRAAPHPARRGSARRRRSGSCSSSRIERLPLVDAERRIRGLITRKDILFLRQRPFSQQGRARGACWSAPRSAPAATSWSAPAALVEAGRRLPGDRHRPRPLRGHGARRSRRCARASARRRWSAATSPPAEGAAFLAERGRRRDQGRGRARPRLPHPARDRRRRAPAAGHPRGLVRGRGRGADHRRRRRAHDKDIFLALVCGASTVMLGSALSGTDESPGQVIEDPATHTKRKIYRGMTSPQAVFELARRRRRRGARRAALETPAEGQEMQVPYKGSVVDILRRIRGHLQSAVSYAGEASLDAAPGEDPARPAALPDPALGGGAPRVLRALSVRSHPGLAAGRSGIGSRLLYSADHKGPRKEMRRCDSSFTGW